MPSQLWQHFQVKSASRAETTAAELLSKIKILTVLFGIFILWLIEIQVFIIIRYMYAVTDPPDILQKSANLLLKSDVMQFSKCLISSEMSEIDIYTITICQSLIFSLLYQGKIGKDGGQLSQ